VATSPSNEVKTASTFFLMSEVAKAHNIYPCAQRQQIHFPN